MKNLKFILILLISFSLNYCVRGRVAQYPGYNYRSTNPKYIQIYYMPPTVPFNIIGEVESAGAPLASWGRVENSMREKAASIGGDAIILISKKSPYVGTYKTPSTGNAFIYGNYIYYTYRPGSSYAMRGKHIIGLVIKWKNKKSATIPTRKPKAIKKEARKPIKKPVAVEEEKKESIIEVKFASLREIEVVIDNSEVRLMPNRESQVIAKVRFGTKLQATGKTGDWYKVNLPSSVEGVVISGYIHKFCVRVIVERD